MLRKLLRTIAKWFRRPSPTVPTRTQPPEGIYPGVMVGNARIRKEGEAYAKDSDGTTLYVTKEMVQHQLDKHTPFKVGESYNIGQMVVTLHANKQSMLDAIAKVDKKREEHHRQLRERAIDIMLMSPEELLKLKVQEWLDGRQRRQVSLIAKLFGFGKKRYVSPAEPQPSGDKQERFKALVKDADAVKEKTPA